MNCPECGSETVLQIAKHGKYGFAPFVCECGHKWEARAATMTQLIKEAESVEDLAKIFVWKRGMLWYSEFCFMGGFLGKENAVKYTVDRLERIDEQIRTFRK